MKIMKKSDLFFNTLRLPVDFVMLLLAGVTTYLLRTEILSAFRPVYFEFNLPLVHFFYLVTGVALLFAGLYAISSLYSMRYRMSWLQECARVFVASSAGIMLVIIYIFLRQELFNSRFLVLGGWLMAIVFVCLGRLLVRFLRQVMVGRYDFGIHRVLLIGDDELAYQMSDTIQAMPTVGYRLAEHLPQPDISEVQALIREQNIDEVILADPHYPANQVTELVNFCQDNHLVFKFVPNLHQTLTTNFAVDVISGVPLVELKHTALDGWGKVVKRALDIIGAVVGLIVFSPFFLVLSILIKLDSKGPVFVQLKRTSKNKEFDLIKFRSMIDNAHSLNPYLRSLGNDRTDAGPLWKLKNDPRVTRVGKFIRRHRIDELPQLINVLKGDMSLVGPRPHQPDEVELYERHHKKVLAIKAGATGLAQVSGSSDLPFDQEVAYDSFYVEHWSLALDLKIIFKTFFKLLSDRSAV